MPAHVLTTKGTSIVNSNGREVLLRGFGLGGWMNMENFITGYPCIGYLGHPFIKSVVFYEWMSQAASAGHYGTDLARNS